jgi:NADH-quinone oxidoreductase subunit L
MVILETIWLIPLYPALGALLMLLAGRRLEKSHQNGVISALCPGLVGVAFLHAAAAVYQLATAVPGHVYETKLFTWIAGLPFQTTAGTLERFQADWGFLLDPLSAVMALIVTGVGFLIHVYSIGYMGHEGGYYRFFGYLNLFMFAMLTLVLANNYVLLFVGWEGVGLCSYLLIGFYFHKRSATDAGKKAFVVNRIGDAAFVLGILLTFATFGSVEFTQVTTMARSSVHEYLGSPAMFWITMLFFIGACGKSAQIPLYVWLPDAMEGPTPVSALIHAATMVTAGVYMVARSNALFVLAPDTMQVVATVGAVTAIFAATIGLVQNDIKRVLAYSTVSQLGYMFLACGVGAFGAGIFHVSTHAYFKALLFLGSGSVIHALSGEQDMRKMGALKDKIPWTFRFFIIAALAIIGLPPLAGFFSKDEILWQAWSNPTFGSKALWLVGFITAGLTAFYMWRLVFLTFFGPSRVDHEVAHHIHESPKVMLIPLGVLAALSVAGGWIGIPAALGGGNVIEHWMAPVFSAGHQAATEAATAHHDSTEYLLMFASVAVALAGVFLAYHFFVRRPESADRAAERFRPVHTLLLNKYYVDEVYSAVFVDGPVFGKKMGSALSAFDAGVVDGGVNGAGWLTRITSSGSIFWDTWVVDGSVRLLGFVTKVLSFPVRMAQTGLVQNYAFVIVLGLLFLSYYLTR